MAASMTITEYRTGAMRRLLAVWVSAADGTASGVSPGSWNGKCELLTTIPAGGGSAPTDNYDITITDADGVDVLAGGGMNRDTANTEQVLGTSLGAVAGSVLTVAIANAGDTKGGSLFLDIR